MNRADAVPTFGFSEQKPLLASTSRLLISGSMVKLGIPVKGAGTGRGNRDIPEAYDELKDGDYGNAIRGLAGNYTARSALGSGSMAPITISTTNWLSSSA